MNRRHFLSMLATAAAGIALDPERALWTPGAKTIFLPPVRPVELATTVSQWDAGLFAVGDIITIEGWYAENPPTRKLQEFVVMEGLILRPKGARVGGPFRASRSPVRR